MEGRGGGGDIEWVCWRASSMILGCVFVFGMEILKDVYTQGCVVLDLW